MSNQLSSNTAHHFIHIRNEAGIGVIFWTFQSSLKFHDLYSCICFRLWLIGPSWSCCTVNLILRFLRLRAGSTPQTDTFLISCGLDGYEDIRILCKMQFELMAGYDAMSINKKTTLTASTIPILIKKRCHKFHHMVTISLS